MRKKGDYMKIQANCFLVNNHSNVRATVNVVLGDAVKVNGIKIIEGENGLFVSMPCYKDKQGYYREICNPISAEFRGVLIDTVMKAYEADKHYAYFNDKPNPTVKARVNLVKEDSPIEAFGSITLDDAFVINNIQIRNNVRGNPFVCLPQSSSYLDKNGETLYPKICEPVTEKFEGIINGMLLKAYQVELEKAKEKESLEQQMNKAEEKKNGEYMDSKDVVPSRGTGPVIG